MHRLWDAVAVARYLLKFEEYGGFGYVAPLEQFPYTWRPSAVQTR